MGKKKSAEVKAILEHKLLKIDYATQKNISFSQFAGYAGCPYAWHLSYREGLAIYKPSIHTVFGTAFHETFQEYLRIFFTEKRGAVKDFDYKDDLLKRMTTIYIEEKAKVEDQKDFSNAKQLQEFYEDGCEILDYIIKNRSAYFSTMNRELVGCEIPLMINPTNANPNVLFKGFIDLVFYNTVSKKYEIWDIKTSTMGWNADAKKDDVKNMQLLLYREFFAKQFNVDKDAIDIKFFIVRRKAGINPYTQKPTSRVQEHVPPTGPKKTKAALQLIEEFIAKCFTQDGKYADVEMPHNASKATCKWCAYRDGACAYAVK